MGIVEVEQFSLVPGLDRAEFARLDAALQQWTYLHREGVRRRTTAFGADGEVLVVTLLAAGAPSEPPPRDDGAPLEAFTDVIEPSSYRRSVYTDLG
jgi:hypothetical protein